MALERQQVVGPTAPPVLTDEEMNALASAPPRTMTDAEMATLDYIPKILSDDEMNTLVAEKPDQATLDRMRDVEQGGKPSFLKTLGEQAVDKLGGLGETVLGAGSAIAGFPLGVASSVGKLGYDIWKSGGRGVDVSAAKEFGEKVTEKAIYQPKTSFGQTTTQALAAPFTVAQEGIKAGAKAITDDPQAQAAIGLAGDAALAFLIPKLAKLTRDAGTAVSTRIYEDSIKQVVKKGIDTGHTPEVMGVIEKTIRENVTPGTILEEVKRNVGTRQAEVKEAMPKLTEPIAEAPAPQKAKQVTIAPDGTTTITFAEPVKPVVEIAPVYMTMPMEKLRDLADYGVDGAKKALKIRTATPKPVEPGKIKTWTDMVNAVPKPEPPKPKWTEIEPIKPSQPPVQMPVKQPVMAVEPKTAVPPSTPTGGVKPFDPRYKEAIDQIDATWTTDALIKERQLKRTLTGEERSALRNAELKRNGIDPSLPMEQWESAWMKSRGLDTTVVKPAPPAGKQPWEMTRAEYLSQSDDIALMRKLRDQDYDPKNTLTTAGDRGKSTKALNASIRNEKSRHEYAVMDAVRAGNPVSAEVLADYPDLVKSAQQPLGEPSGIPEAKQKTKAQWPPKREKPPARDRSEMTGFEAWKYDEKMGGLPRKEYEPPRPPRPTEEQSFAKEVRRHYSRAFENGEISWDKLTPDEVALLEKSFAPEEIAAFKAKPTVEILPEFTEADAIAKAAAEQKVKRDRYQDLPENLSVSPEWLPEYDNLIAPALVKAKIKPEHQATATLLLKHGFSMKKVAGKDPAKAMEHYLNSIKPRLRSSERFPEAQFPEVQTEGGRLEIEPTEAMAKGEVGPKGKNVVPEPAEVEAVAKRRERGLEAISKIVDEYETTIADPKEKEMFRTYREGKSGKEGERELAARGVKVSDDTLNKYIKKWQADLQEHGQARKDVIKKAMDELTGDEFDKTTAALADKMEKDLGPVKGPKIGLTVEMAHPIPEPPKGGEKFAFPEGTEARYEASKHLVKPTTIQKVNKFLTDAYHGASRVYQDLPRGAEWVEVVQTLKNLEKQPGIVSDKLNRTYKSMYHKLNRDTYDLTARKALLNDLLHEADAGRDLPFGFDEKSLRGVASKLDVFIKDNAPVHEALKNRADVWDGLRKEYIYWREKAGHDVEDILTKPDYFRHKVLEVAKSDYNKVGPGKKLRLRTGQGFLQKRGGSEMDILSDLVSADYEVMSTMLRDIADAKALVKIRAVADKADKFRAEAKKEGVPIEEVIPDEYTKWQPKEGHLMYVADTLPAKIAEKIMNDELTNIGVVKDKLRKSLSMGRERETWIIKKELAATLDKLGAQKEAKLLGDSFKTSLTAWKRWTLLSPRRAIKYNLRNVTGDADHVFVGSPGVFLKAPQAIKEMWPAYAGDRPLSGNLRDWADRGGFQSLLQIQDIGELKKLPVYRNLYKPNVLNDINVFKHYWRFVNNATNYREGILRYSAYLKYLEDMQKSPTGKPKNFGASFPEEIMALPDIKDRAARLSNELLGPYDEVSPIGVEISSKVYPFWRWKEVNAKFYARIIKNIANNDEAAVKTAKGLLGGARIAASAGTRTLIGAGRFALKAMGLTALLTAWNNLVMEDEEKDLPEDVRNRTHLTLGRDKDGSVIAFTRLGALGDMLEWFGMDNAYGHMTDYLNGRKTLKEIAVDMVKSPVNIVAGGLSPFIKSPIEAAVGKTLFPDAFSPKTIRDRWAFLFRQVGLEDEYKAVVGKPGKPYLSTLSQAAIYKYDPLETAYYDFLDIKRDYLKSIGRGTGGSYLSPSSDALYNMKLAYRWGEHDKVKKYLQQYADIVIMQHPNAKAKEIGDLVKKGIAQSFRMLHPLSGIKRDDWKDYVKSLDPEAKETLGRALRFYNEILLGKSETKEND
jgi:hypothetical protein